MPERTQLSRRKGWRMPENTVKVDRTSLFGNPFIVTTKGDFAVEGGRTASQAVQAFRDLCSASPAWREMAAKLRGKNLACWCSLEQPCHADVLLELANQEPRAHDRG